MYISRDILNAHMPCRSSNSKSVEFVSNVVQLSTIYMYYVLTYILHIYASYQIYHETCERHIISLNTNIWAESFTFVSYKCVHYHTIQLPTILLQCVTYNCRSNWMASCLLSTVQLKEWWFAVDILALLWHVSLTSCVKHSVPIWN